MAVESYSEMTSGTQVGTAHSYPFQVVGPIKFEPQYDTRTQSYTFFLGP